MTVKMRTEKTKTEKQRLLMSLMRFCPMGSVAGLESFMPWEWERGEGIEDRS